MHDGEVPTHDKCFMKNCELDHNNISTMLKYELDMNSSTEVSKEARLYISTDGEAYPKHNCIKDDVKLSKAGNTFMEDKADSGASNETADAHSEDESISQRLINNFSCAQIFNSNYLRDEQEDNQDQNTEAIQEDSLTLKKEAHNNDRNTAINIMGSGRMGQNSDSLLTMILGEKSKEIAEVEQLFKAEKMQEKADTMSKNSVPLLSSQSAVGLPECESFVFSTASPPSGRLTFPGSVPPHSDSMSLRSNSTTSTQSFAFPILATEWNESPVRMAKADRRRLEKPRCLRMCFTCFTF